MKKALVTGGQGFIGGHLVDRLIKDKYEVVVIDNQSSTCSDFHINAKAIYIDGDIADISLYKDMFETHGRFVQESIEKPAVAVFDNVLGSCNVLEYCRMTRPQKVVLSSTCSVYGLNENVPFNEEESPDCLNPYSLTKNQAEELFQLYHKIYSVETLILRYFNVFGPRAPKTGSYAPVVSKFIDQVKEGTSPTIYGTGSNTRDYVHVHDVVEANILAADSGLSLSGQIFNVGTGKDYSVLEIADMVKGDLDVEFMAPKEGECKKVVADISKIKKELSWEPKHDLESYVKKELKSLTKKTS